MKYFTVIDPLNLTNCRLQPGWGIGYSEQQVCHLALLLYSNFMSNYAPFCWTQHMGKDAAVYELHEIDFKLELLSSITFYHYIIFNISDNSHKYVGIKYFIALVGKCSHSSNEQQYKEKKDDTRWNNTENCCPATLLSSVSLVFPPRCQK